MLQKNKNKKFVWLGIIRLLHMIYAVCSYMEFSILSVPKQFPAVIQYSLFKLQRLAEIGQEIKKVT